MNASHLRTSSRASALIALVTISFGSGCNEAPTPPRPSPSIHAATQSGPTPDAARATIVAAAAPIAPPAARQVEPAVKGGQGGASALTVKRFVIVSGVKDREPLVGEQPLVSDGTPIYAFAELSNQLGDSENVRITFERRGGKEKVGDVSLPVPGSVARHRTWAFTRLIRAPGVWDAVLWNENGAELSRASFEVTAG